MIIALLDSKHASHQRAHDWWQTEDNRSWASCPLTQNGVLRIMSGSGYDSRRRFPIGDVFEQLSEFIENTRHEFWTAEISILDDFLFNLDRIHGPKQLTYIYLLAMATGFKGQLVTFDQSIPISAVKNAKAENLVVL